MAGGGGGGGEDMLLLVNYKILRPLFLVTLHLLTNNCIALGCRYDVLRKSVPMHAFCPDATLEPRITQCNTCIHLYQIRSIYKSNLLRIKYNHNVQP